MELERIALASSENASENNLDLFDLLHYMLRKFRYLISAALIGALLAGIYAFILATPIYESTAQLYVVNSKDSALDLSDLQIGTYLTSDYELVFDTWEVNQQVKNNLNLDYTIEELREMVEVHNPSDTRALLITVSSTDPVEAAYMANEYAEVAKQYIYDTMLSEMPTTLSVALQPEEPVHPRRLLITAVGFVFGAFVCAIVLFLFYLRDDKIKTPADLLKYTGAMPLAVIPVTETVNHRRRREPSSSERRNK